MPKLEVTDDQLLVIQRALEYYARIGIGQFCFISEHPTFENFLVKEFKKENGETDWNKYHQRMNRVKAALTFPRNLLIDDMHMPENGSWGIYHPDVDESCRVAFDIAQVVRHEKWKVNPNKSDVSVADSVHFTSQDSAEIKVEL